MEQRIDKLQRVIHFALIAVILSVVVQCALLANIAFQRSQIRDTQEAILHALDGRSGWREETTMQLNELLRGQQSLCVK
jgi:hypothetical protein